MKKEEKGTLAINIVTNGDPVIIFEPVNTTVWMDWNDLCMV